jgi:glutamate-5-semialdehyde dehydrogenase
MTTLNDQLNVVKQASYDLPMIPHVMKKAVIADIAVALMMHKDFILKSNQEDLKAFDSSDPMADRLRLTPERLQAMADSLENILDFDAPINKVLEQRTLPNGLELQRVTVPLGVIGMIYESRPNVTMDAFALSFMSSNACVLKGGKEAYHSNLALIKIIQDCLTIHSIDTNVVLLLPPSRDVVHEMLTAVKTIDVIIPRGSQTLIDFVKKNSLIPIIETGAGVVHIYVDRSADLDKAQKIITNAKTRRVSVCNALDCLIVHREQLSALPRMLSELATKKVQIVADALAFKALETTYPKELLDHAQSSDYGTEFLSLKLAIKTVNNLEEAILHIRQYSSMHSEAIVAEDEKAIETFFNQVDAAVVYSNASTAFTDGGEFGMGGEIGISTQKLHVRGPFSMQHLVSSKWLVKGNGQVRPI